MKKMLFNAFNKLKNKISTVVKGRKKPESALGTLTVSSYPEQNVNSFLVLNSGIIKDPVFDESETLEPYISNIAVNDSPILSEQIVVKSMNLNNL